MADRYPILAEGLTTLAAPASLVPDVLGSFSSSEPDGSKAVKPEYPSSKPSTAGSV
jgi:hypothetical protein